MLKTSDVPVIDLDAATPVAARRPPHTLILTAVALLLLAVPGEGDRGDVDGARAAVDAAICAQLTRLSAGTSGTAGAVVIDDAGIGQVTVIAGDCAGR